jgi:hypothetical protein
MAISGLEEPEAAFLSQKLDRQVTDHALSAADHLSSDAHKEDGDRQREANDRLPADRQRGLFKPNSSSVGIVIGLIGRFEE